MQSKTIKIAFFGPITGGGRERRMCELIRALKQKGGYEIHLFHTKDGVQTYNYILDYIDKEHIFCQNSSFLLNLVNLIKEFRKINPQIVHTWSIFYTPYTNLLRLFFKFYYIVGYLADANKDSKKNFYLKAIPSYLLSNKIISNSKAGLISHRAPLYKSCIIYNGFNPDRLPTQNRENDLRKELELGSNYVVSMAARMDHTKNFKMFLDIAKNIQSIRDDVYFLLLGRGELENELKLYAKKNCINNIRFLGFRNDIVDIMAMSYVSILCTNNEVHGEGVSNSIMESMAVGTPVLATAGGGTSEIVENEYNGYITDPKDVKQMTEKLLFLIANKHERERMSNNAKLCIYKTFSINKMLSEYIEIYNRV